MHKKLTFGVLIEILEDWIQREQVDNRIIVQFVDGEGLTIEIPVGGTFFNPGHDTIWLVAKRRDEEDIYDDSGVLLNDESPSGIYRDIEVSESEDIGYDTPVGIEIWFTDGVDDIQYRIESHSYAIEDHRLIVQHILDEQDDDIEFLELLDRQYSQI